MAACIGYGLWAGRERARAYHGLMLFLTGAIVGVFTAQDLLVFYAFFDAMLIPLYVLVGVWGGPNRGAATLKLVIYTLAGSLLMLAAVIVLGLQQGTFDLVDGGTSSSFWIFLGFMAAFAVKAPFFPLHGWLPDAYREAPPEVSAVLSGVVSKAAMFGLLRIAIAKFPGPTADIRPAVLALAAVGLVYGSLLRVSGSGFPRRRRVLLARADGVDHARALRDERPRARRSGAAGGQPRARLGGALPARRASSRRARAPASSRGSAGWRAGGRALATTVMLAGVLSLAVPLSANFAGEFLILAGVFTHGWGWSVVGALGIVLAAMYMLRAISGVLHQDVGPAVVDAPGDLRGRELAIVVPLLGCLLALSAWPQAISGHSFGPTGASAGDRAGARRLAGAEPAGRLEPVPARGGVAVIARPHVDWLSISPELVLLGAAGVLLLGAVIYPGRLAARRLRLPRRARLRRRLRRGRRRLRPDAGRRAHDRRRALPRPLRRARAGDRLRRRPRRGRRLLRRAAPARARRRVLRAPDRGRRGHGLLRHGREPDDAVPRRSSGSRSASTCSARSTIDLEGSLEAGLKYLIVGGFGSAVLLFGSALVYGATGELSLTRDRRRGRRAGPLRRR